MDFPQNKKVFFKREHIHFSLTDVICTYCQIKSPLSFWSGLCAEEHASRSMWVEPESVGFLKGVRIEGFDPTSILHVGGAGAEKHVGLLFQDNCPLPPLPNANSDHVLLLTPENLLLSCGGDAHPRACIFLDVAAATWNQHSSLTEQREGSVAITLPGGSFIFGGMQSPKSSDYLPANSQTWEKGPAIYGDGIDRGCGVKVNDTALLLIGGYSGGRESNQVLMYTDVGGWFDNRQQGGGSRGQGHVRRLSGKHRDHSAD